MIRRDAGNILTESLVLGAGGKQPGLWLLRPGSNQPQELLMLAPGESVYSLSLHTENALVVAGTRAGTVHVISLDGDRAEMHATLLQGAPVLATCFLDGARLVTADAAGKCLLWRRFANEDVPETLPMGQGCICSFLKIAEDRAAALCSDGRLLMLDVDRLKIIQTVQGPSLPPKGTMARLHYWPSQNAVAYPARGGQVVAFGLDDLILKAWPAHQTASHTLVMGGDGLFSIGVEDGLMKMWTAPGGPARTQCHGPQGVFCGQPLPDGSGDLLLIDQHGRAGIYVVDGGAFRQTARLGDQTFRSVTGPSYSERQEAACERRLSQARELQEQIQTRIDASRLDGLEEMYSQLEGLGFPTDSMGFRIQQAVRQQDLLAELALRHRLVQVLPPADAQAEASVLPYAAILERLWRPAEAQTAYAKVAGHKGDVQRLGEVVRIMAEEDWVVQPREPLSVLIQAANTMESPFNGRWVLQASAPIRVTEPALTARDLVVMLRRVRGELGVTNLSVAEQLDCWWLSESAPRQAHLALFNPPDGPQGYVQPAVSVCGDELQSSFVPLVLFNAAAPAPDVAVPDHNHRVLCAYEWLSQKDLIEHWPAGLRQMVIAAIRRLRNLAKIRSFTQETP